MNNSIAAVNEVDRAAFVALLGSIYEETPAVADRVWRDRPFRSVTDLHQKMMAVVACMSEEEQIALICAHPELGTSKKVAAASMQEQAMAGLGEIDEAEREQLSALNVDYRRQFGFPFVMAVKGYGKADIMNALEARLKNTRAEEKARSLIEINKIARLRLEDLLSD